MTIGAMFACVFFGNLGKGAYTPAGYAAVINYHIKASHSPAAWKWVLGLMAGHAAMAAPMQAAMEISLGILLVVDLSSNVVTEVNVVDSNSTDGTPDLTRRMGRKSSRNLSEDSGGLV